MEYTVVDNFLEKDDFDYIQNIISSNEFPWFYGVVVEDDAIVTQELAKEYNFQFTHVFYNNFSPNSEYFKILNKLILKINPKALLRIKANLSTRTPEIIEYGYHIDFSDVISCVYYLNTNNGYTKFQNGEIVNSVANRALFFNSNLPHTGTSCTDENRRMAINLNFVKG